MELTYIILVIACASLLKGITGFGFTLVALPPLMLWYSPKEIIPVIILCNLFSSSIIVLQKKEKKLVDKSFRTLIFFAAFFTVIGVITLNYLPEHILIIVMCVFFILLSFCFFFGLNISLKTNKFSFRLAGAFTGFLTGSISISGPPLAIFLRSVKVDNQQFREIFSWYDIVTAIIALLSFGMFGMLDFQIFKLTLLFTPILFLGTYFGKRLNNHISSRFFDKLNTSLTLLSSILILLRQTVLNF